MYKLQKDIEGNPLNNVQRLTDTAFIPFALENADYRTFKDKVLDGEELQDADGNVMTQEQVNEFIKDLP